MMFRYHSDNFKDNISLLSKAFYYYHSMDGLSNKFHLRIVTFIKYNKTKGLCQVINFSVVVVL